MQPPSEMEMETLSNKSYEFHDHKKGLNDSFIHLFKLEIHMQTKLPGELRGRGVNRHTHTVQITHICTLILQLRSYDNG